MDLIAIACLLQVTHYNNPKILAEVSEDLGAAMVGLTMYDRSHSRSWILLTHFPNFSDKDLKGGHLAERGH